MAWPKALNMVSWCVLQSRHRVFPRIVYHNNDPIFTIQFRLDFKAIYIVFVRLCCVFILTIKFTWSNRIPFSVHFFSYFWFNFVFMFDAHKTLTIFWPKPLICYRTTEVKYCLYICFCLVCSFVFLMLVRIR